MVYACRAGIKAAILQTRAECEAEKEAAYQEGYTSGERKDLDGKTIEAIRDSGRLEERSRSIRILTSYFECDCDLDPKQSSLHELLLRLESGP